MEKNNILKRMKAGQVAYESLVGKEIHYIYLKNKKYHELIVTPKPENFLHLCGIKYICKDAEIARTFYRKLKRNEITINDFEEKENVGNKMGVINQLETLLTCNRTRVIDKRITYELLDFNRALRSNNIVFAVTLQKNGIGYVPESLLDLRQGNKINIDKGYFVHCIYSVDRLNDTYNLIDYTKEFREGKYNYEKDNSYITEHLNALKEIAAAKEVK